MSQNFVVSFLPRSLILPNFLRPSAIPRDMERNMKREQIADMLARIERKRDAIDAANTPENEARLMALAESRGMRLIRRRKGAEGFAFKIPGKSEIDGISLADVDALLQQLR